MSEIASQPDLPVQSGEMDLSLKNNRWQYLKLLFTHHPLCGFFEDDVYDLGKVQLCKGCTAGYSGIFTTIVVIFAGLLPAFLKFSDLLSYFLVILITAPFVVLYDIQKSKKIIPRFPIRFGMGAFFIVSIYTIWHIDPWYAKLPIIFFIFAMSNIIGFLRYKKLNKVCSTHCGDRRLDWCPYALGTEPAPEYVLYLKTISTERDEIVAST